MVPRRGRFEVDGNRGEAAGLDLHHGVDRPEGGAGQGEDFNDAVRTTSVFNLHLETKC